MTRYADQRPKDGQRVRVRTAFSLIGSEWARTGTYRQEGGGGAWAFRKLQDFVEVVPALPSDEWEPIEEAP